MIKTCKRCGLEKDETLMSNWRLSLQSHQPLCKDCHAKDQRIWILKNKPKVQIRFKKKNKI